MIRRPSTAPELGLDSLTDTMTNMMGVILLMVVVTVIMSGGMRLVLLGQLSDPVGKTPLYLVCRDGRIRFLHNGNAWQRELAQLCAELERSLGRKPTTSEAIVEANRRGLCKGSDLAPTFVREKVRENGREVYVVGLRFHPRTDKPAPGPMPLLTPAAAKALAAFDPKRQYIDTFLYQSGIDAFKTLQARAKEHHWSLGWRPMLAYQTPGLSDYGMPGTVGGDR